MPTQSVLGETTLTTTCIALTLPAVLMLQLTPPKSGPFTVVTLPFSSESADEVIARADGRILQQGRWSWVAVGISSEDDGFSKRLTAAGASLLLPGSPPDCLTTPLAHERLSQ